MSVQQPPVSASLRARILGELAGTRAPLPETGTVVDLIAAQVGTRGQAKACVFEDESLTYAELDARATSTAAALEARGARKGDNVAVLVGNSLDLPVAILACLKLGAVFMPLDSMWPARRLEALLHRIDPKAILIREPVETPDALRERLVECASAPDAKSAAGRAREPILQTDLAYGFPTSGSTGLPKLALNVHRGLLNRLLYMTRRFGSGPSEVVLQNSRPVFDSSLWQLLWPLTNGATVVIPTPTRELDLGQTIALIERHRVTMTDFVPSVFNTLVEHLEDRPADVPRLASLRHLLIGGEEISPKHCRRFTSLLPDCRLTNTYGPTEASIGMVFHELSDSDGEVIPIGRPIDNTVAVVLDDERRLVAPGVAGELYIGGACLGAGYLNDPERTAEAWVPNPFPELPGALLYRTGDRVRQTPDGTLFFIGRADRQVQIAGIRVELGEVEHALVSHDAVHRAVVATEETAAGQRLVAYLVSRGVTAGELRDHLLRLLPSALVPSRFLFLDELPMTHNGKLDRRRLATMTTPPAPEPRGETDEERTLFEIWSELLNRSDFDVDDDFFLLGGDSLLVVHLVSAVGSRLGRRVPLHAVYETPTIRMLAALIGGHGAVPASRASERELHILERDCRLVDDLPPPAAARRGIDRVLVTGATGFVGAHVLAELLARTRSEVLFLVRAHSAADAVGRLRDVLVAKRLWEPAFAERLTPIAGDLGSSALGLAPAAWDELQRTVDVIVNCGAAVDFLHDYRRLRPANVVAVAELLRLASGGAQVHHMSSLSSRHQADPPAGGYGRTKWVAEHLVERARASGRMVTTHRLGEVMPHSLTGVPNERSLAHALIRSCLVLGLYPRGLVELDYSPADHVAAAIVDSVVGAAPTDATLEHFHPRGTTLDAIMQCARADGATVAAVTGVEFGRALESRCEWDGDRALHALRCYLAAAEQAQPGAGAADALLTRLFAAPARAVPRFRPRDSGARWPDVDATLLRPMLAAAAAQPTLDARARRAGSPLEQTF